MTQTAHERIVASHRRLQKTRLTPEQERQAEIDSQADARRHYLQKLVGVVEGIEKLSDGTLDGAELDHGLTPERLDNAAAILRNVAANAAHR